MIRTPAQIELRRLFRRATAAERIRMRTYLAAAYDPMTAFILAVVMPQAALTLADRQVSHG